MINKSNLLLGAGAVGLVVAGVAVYLTSSKSTKKEGEKEESTPQVVSCSSNKFGDVSNLEIGVEGLTDGDNLGDKLSDMQELDPSEACFSFSNVTYPEGESDKKLKSGKFEFSAIKTEENQSTKGVFVKTELKDSKELSGIVVILSKAKDPSAWTIEKGFGFSIKNFEKELKVDSISVSSGDFKWSVGQEGSFFKVFTSNDENNYKPLLGFSLKEENGLEVTKIYSDNNWKKVKEGESNSLKDKIKDVVKADTQGTWTFSTPAA